MSRIGLIGENSIEYIDRLLNIWNGGDCAILIDWRIPVATAVVMMKDAGVQVCYFEKSKYDIANYSNYSKDINFIIYERGSNSAELLPVEIYDKFNENYSHEEAIILYSSGTTGKSRGVILSHFAINTNADAIIDYMKPTAGDCIYIAKSLSHSSTLTGELLVALKSKTKLVISPTIVPPRFMFRNIKKFHVSIVCLNPTLLKKFAEEYQTGRYALSTLKKIYVSGSILNDKIYELAHNTFKDIAVYNVYGLTETAPRVTSQREDCCSTNSVGKPIKDVEVKIIGDNGEPVNQGERGIVHVNTPSRFNGYVSGTTKHESIYNGWLNSGDIGYFDENDELHIVDRIDDVIIIDSHKIYPSEIEQQIINNTEIDECIVVKLDFNDNEFIGCLYTDQKEIDENIKEKLMKVLMPYEIPRLFLKNNSIPKILNGKVSKKEVYEILIKSLGRKTDR